MGEVYRARDTRLGRTVAIKVLPERLAQDQQALSRFEQEARSVASLSHPNILSIHDFGSSDGIVFAVMELLEGESLDHRIAKENLSWRKAIEIGIAIADGLAAAHSRGIIHRDLKPANIFVTREGHVKILDFGLAKHSPLHPTEESTLSKVQTETGAGVVLGTLGYMSPEQASGKAADARSDIFALGCVLYEMLSGRRAFVRSSAGETIAAILRDQPPDLLETAQNIPPAVVSLVRRCLEKNTEERFQSARDLSFALKETLSGPTYIDSTSPMEKESVRLTRWVLPLVLLITITGGLVLFSPRLSFKNGKIKSLAVLPITNISGDPEQEYWADGITEQLISNVARLGDIRVTSRTSAMSYKGAKKPLPQIAKELGVEAVVEGVFLRSGRRIKLNVDLIEASSEKRLWANTYERDVEDILNIQTDIARSIAESIQLQLSPEARAKISIQNDRIDSLAYESFVRGRYFLNRRTRTDLDKAVEHFQKALDSEPAYAVAYSGLADSYALLGYLNYEPPDVAFPKAKAAATRALELDSGLAEAHASLGYVFMYYDWDFAASESEFKKAIALNSNLASAHHFYGIYLAAMLRADEADREIREARNLDPLSVSVATDMGFVLYYDRNYNDAARVLKDAISMNPKSAPAHWWLGRIYQAENKYQESADEYIAAGPGLSEWPPALASLGHLYGIWGKRDEALKVIHDMDEMSKQSYVSPYAPALVYLGLGDDEQTFSLLNRSYTERANWMVWLLKDPRWDRLRSDPRFIEIVKKVGFPQDARERAPKGPVTQAGTPAN